MPPVRRRSRGYEPTRVRNALVAQVENLRTAAHGLTPDQLLLPTGLPGWDVHRLLTHVATQIDALPRLLAEPAPAAQRPEVGVPDWAGATGEIAAELDRRTQEEAARVKDPAAAIDDAIAELDPVLETAVSEDVLLPHRFGAMRALDFALTRLIELVVHSDDLARALRRPVTLDRYALATSVRLLADTLAVRAPGGSVEVRVPPFAVVQCVHGPRHTRGTPPNTVETDPLTWLRLATGRVTWERAVAAGAVSASGQRANLAEHLPIMR
ncbi:maleylpyruvate isomerase family mycothiol-dependent enzyme [Streptomyces durbertensis]|uniref:Maleylpyruvate isomerase family mycothiol-dependent enzyme n=1 Tax=Streptomyces durbertensis TaxID=2448886 RepID=A0ABR6EER4_9ACTN|nr:maleylpyruvate isomerase family mycothiol-dependent enzyme [Streptomyces durbertensis]MBB1243743.1 maleylpyruvate isomerase family mycothiol-dependent enzyme [Streptomyces durbertensis]